VIRVTGPYDLRDHKIVFVCGLHRSGTSILFKALRGHPQISGFKDTGAPEDEGMHLQSVYKPSGDYGGAGRFGFEPQAHLTETSPLATDSNRLKLYSEWSPYWDLAKPYLLEKSPPNLIRTRFLQAMFPNSYFLVILRHPVAVSLATRRWYRTLRFYTIRLRTVFEHWLTCHELFWEDRRYLDHYLVLKYEQLVHQPERSLGQIYTFLGLEMQPLIERLHAGINEKYFAQWQYLRDGLFSRYPTRRLERDFEARIRRFGYSFIDLRRIEAITQSLR
jgi:hypothetical protein